MFNELTLTVVAAALIAAMPVAWWVKPHLQNLWTLFCLYRGVRKMKRITSRINKQVQSATNPPRTDVIRGLANFLPEFVEQAGLETLNRYDLSFALLVYGDVHGLLPLREGCVLDIRKLQDALCDGDEEQYRRAHGFIEAAGGRILGGASYYHFLPLASDVEVSMEDLQTRLHDYADKLEPMVC